jgi:NAD(P)-dependent dehydrogenase (short-subunit alcohol dehydrogenase family)
VLAELKGRTAVITGAASGIGLGLARRCAERGMNIAVLDVEPGALERAAVDIGDPSRVFPLTVDVSDDGMMMAAAAAVADRFGPVHLLCNNAGISITGALWEMTENDCRWLLDVNLLGVMNGVRAFVPAMIASGEPGHVVNTASLAGLIPMSNASVYSATKAAVEALSEVLHHDLDEAGVPIGVSVLCPGLVNTNILLSERNRPGDRSGSGAPPIPDAAHAAFAIGDDPLEVADRVLAAVASDDFVILTNQAGRPDLDTRLQAIRELRVPPPPRQAAITPDRFIPPAES